MLADQMLRRLEYLHNKGYVHRDIKPKNFSIGIHENSHVVYLTNFELSKQYKNSKTGNHRSYTENRQMVGSLSFSSVNCHLSIESSRRDDLESLLYTLIFLAKGILPWDSVNANSFKEKEAKTMEKKMTLPPEMICKALPDSFSAYLNYVKTMKYEEKPDYRYLRGLFSKTMEDNEWAYDYNYDWVLQKTGAPKMHRYDFRDLSLSFQVQATIPARTEASRLEESASRFPIEKESPDIGNPSKSLSEAKTLADEFIEEDELEGIVPADLSISEIRKDSLHSKEFFMPNERIDYFVSHTIHSFPEHEKVSFDIDEEPTVRRELKRKSLTTKISRKNGITEAFSVEDNSKTEGNSLIKTISLKIPDNLKNRETAQNVFYAEEETFMESKSLKHKKTDSTWYPREGKTVDTFKSHYFEEANTIHEEAKESKPRRSQTKAVTFAEDEYPLNLLDETKNEKEKEGCQIF